MDLSEPSCILLPGLPGSDGAGYGGAGQGGHGSGQGGHGVEPGGEEASGTSWRSLPSTPIILIAGGSGVEQDGSLFVGSGTPLKNTWLSAKKD